MVDSTEKAFDFDYWRSLAERDPAAFEKARRAAIDAVIAGVPADRRHRLEGLQWRIDTERTLAPNPTAAFIKLADMMWDSFYRQRAMLERLVGDAADAHAEKPASTIVPFRQIR